MTSLFVLDIPENTGVIEVARSEPGVTVTMVGPYFEIEAEGTISIDRRAAAVRHAVWYSAVAGLRRARIVQFDKDALRVETT